MAAQRLGAGAIWDGRHGGGGQVLVIGAGGGDQGIELRVAEARGDAHRSAECHATAAAYAEAVEAHAWDGDWYRRAYFDDGTPMGTAGAVLVRSGRCAGSTMMLAP